MKRICFLVLLITCSAIADEDVTKNTNVAAALAAYNKQIEASDETEAKAIDKAKKENVERKAASKKRLVLALRSAAAGSKDAKAIKDYADQIENDSIAADLPEKNDEKKAEAVAIEKSEPLKFKIGQDASARGQFITEVKKGQTVKITATGKWYTDKDSICDANGRKDRVAWDAKEFPGGSLCGIFKDGQNDPVKFFVGSNFTKKFNVDGKLYLFGNASQAWGASGTVDVTIIIE